MAAVKVSLCCFIVLGLISNCHGNGVPPAGGSSDSSENQVSSGSASAEEVSGSDEGPQIRRFIRQAEEGPEESSGDGSEEEGSGEDGSPTILGLFAQADEGPMESSADSSVEDGGPILLRLFRQADGDVSSGSGDSSEESSGSSFMEAGSMSGSAEVPTGNGVIKVAAATKP